MIKNLPKFDNKNPQNKEEKIIVEIIDKLYKTLYDFMEENDSIETPNEAFVIIKDASINFSAMVIRKISTTLVDKNQIPKLFEECEAIFKESLRQDFN